MTIVKDINILNLIVTLLNISILFSILLYSYGGFDISKYKISTYIFLLSIFICVGTLLVEFIWSSYKIVNDDDNISDKVMYLFGIITNVMSFISIGFISVYIEFNSKSYKVMNLVSPRDYICAILYATSMIMNIILIIPSSNTETN